MAKKIIFALVFTLILAGCKKDNTGSNTPIHSGPDVYLTGYGAYNLNLQGSLYWKNGQLIPLPGGQFATGIGFKDTNVYVCGNAAYAMPPSLGGGDATEAVYWKNGVMTKLGNAPSYASAISISGTDIYIAGNAEVNNNYVAVYWKNGNLISLGDIPHSTATSLAISGTDVYVAGVAGSNGQFATYWKNGSLVYLEDSLASRANGIVLSGNDIYVAGYVINNLSSDEAVYWKNGGRVSLNPPSVDPEVVFTYASAIAVSGTDLYITGYMNNYYALYWKNGVQISLNNPATYENMTNNVNGIVVRGSDVYISFNSSDYWKNNSIFHVGNGYATSIAVRP